MNKISIFILFIISLTLTGCGGGDGDNKNTQSSLVGSWRKTEIKSGTASMTCPGSVQLQDANGNPILSNGDSNISCSKNDLITLKSDGTYTNKVLDETGVSQITQGTWTASGDSLTVFDDENVDENGNPTPSKSTYSLSGNNLTLTITSPEK